MKNNFILRVFALFALLSTVSTSWSQEAHAYFKFAEQAGYDFQILIFGSESGTAQIDWGNGNEQIVQIEPDKGTVVMGKTQSQELTIKGNISAIDCSGNELLELKVNSLPMLQSLVSRKNYVQNLDLSGNPMLGILCIENSPLAKLDLSQNAMLDTVILVNNKLTQLTMPNTAEKMSILDCSYNRLLAEVDLTHCTNLKKLQLLQTSVTKLPLSQHKKLHYISAGLMRPITQLEFADDNVIDTLYLPMAGLSSIDLSSCKKLKLLVVDNNFMLSQLDCSQLKDLTWLNCEGTALTQLDVSNCKELETLNCNNCSIGELDLSHNNKLKVLGCFVNELNELKLGNTVIENLDCSYNAELSNLELPATLKDLNCESCNIEELSFPNPAIMESLVCGRNQIKALEVSQMEQLSALTCDNNQIKTLNTNSLKELLNVNVSNNSIEDVVFDNSPRISYINVNGTSMGVNALDNLYRSVRRIPLESQETGVYYLMNDVPEASVSSTSIAQEKGWTVAVEGDGSGSTSGIADITEQTNKTTVTKKSGGWIIGGLPANAQMVRLYTMDGRFAGEYQRHGQFVYIPAAVGKGVFVVAGNDFSAKVSLR